MSEWYDTDLRASLDKDRAVNGGAIKPSSPVIDPSLNLALGGGAGNSSSTTQEQHAVAAYAALSPPPTTSTLRSHTDSQAVSCAALSLHWASRSHNPFAACMLRDNQKLPELSVPAKSKRVSEDASAVVDEVITVSNHNHQNSNFSSSSSAVDGSTPRRVTAPVMDEPKARGAPSDEAPAAIAEVADETIAEYPDSPRTDAAGADSGGHAGHVPAGSAVYEPPLAVMCEEVPDENGAGTGAVPEDVAVISPQPTPKRGGGGMVGIPQQQSHIGHIIGSDQGHSTSTARLQQAQKPSHHPDAAASSPSPSPVPALPALNLASTPKAGARGHHQSSSTSDGQAQAHGAVTVPALSWPAAAQSSVATGSVRTLSQQQQYQQQQQQQSAKLPMMSQGKATGPSSRAGMIYHMSRVSDC